MKQECSLWNVWLTWLSLPLLAIGMGAFQGWWAGAIVLVAGAFAQVFYVREFPRLSRWLGYGSVRDVAADKAAPEIKPGTPVILYTANVCPFCPIVRKRLVELQRTLGFELKEVDVTFHPNLVKEKGFRSVPVIEMNGRHWVGNATSAELAAFLTRTDSEAPETSA